MIEWDSCLDWQTGMQPVELRIKPGTVYGRLWHGWVIWVTGMQLVEGWAGVPGSASGPGALLHLHRGILAHLAWPYWQHARCIVGVITSSDKPKDEFQQPY
jgi:hypothetical protein